MTDETSSGRSGPHKSLVLAIVAVLVLMGVAIALPKAASIYTDSIKKKQARMIYGDVEAKQRRISRYENGTETRPRDLRMTDFNVEVDENLSGLIGKSTSNTMKTTIWQYLRPDDPRPPHLVRNKTFYVSEEGRSYWLFIENETVVPRKPVRQIMLQVESKNNGMSGVIEAIGIRYKCPVKAADYTWQIAPYERKQK